MMKMRFFAMSLALASGGLASAGAATPFEGRLADGQPSSSCTVSGGDKCTTFYSAALDITILNDWSVGTGFWDPAAPAGSAQALAAAAGHAASGLAGWGLPAGDANQPAGTLNQFLSIWNAVGASYAGLSGQFDGVGLNSFFWASTLAPPNLPNPNASPWWFRALTGMQGTSIQASNRLYVVAVRAGDIATAVPEPRSLLLMLAGLGALVGLRRRLGPR